MTARSVRLVIVPLVLGLVMACKGGGRASAGGAGSSSAAVAAPPPPLDTSWERVAPRLLAVSENAPDFEGIAHTGMRVRLSALLDKPVVVCFYDSDGSDVARALVGELRDRWLTLLPKVSMVIGVSSDDRVRHRDFATAERLPFLVVADEKSSIARAFGVSPGAAVTFVIGRDKKVLAVFTGSQPGKRADEILGAVR